MNTITQLISILSLCLLNISIQAQTYFTEGFEHDGNKPLDWFNEYVAYGEDWSYKNGGDGGAFNFPDTAYNGEYNAVLYYNSTAPRITKLVNSPIDLEFAIKPMLTFWHAQVPSGGLQDELKVYFKQHLDSNWVYLNVHYDQAVNEWTKREIFLPDSLLSSTSHIGFEGITGWGYGTCIDSISIIETGIIPIHLQSVDVSQYPVNSIPSGYKQIPLIKIKLGTYGNSGNLILDSIAFQSLNDTNEHISPDGIKLFTTKNPIFNPETQVGVLNGFTDNKAMFSNLNLSLPSGYTYLWLTYHCDTAATEGSILDAALCEKSIKTIIDTNSITFNEHIYRKGDSIYYVFVGDTNSVPIVNHSPANDISPDGEITITSGFFYDDFDQGIPWTMDGEFEITAPQGLGDTVYANPDPQNSIIGTNVLGYDLTGDGNYQANMDTTYWAVSPMFNCKFYKDVGIHFYRKLNTSWYDEGNGDKADLMVSNDGGNTWQKLWNNDKTVVYDKHWDIKQYSIPQFTKKDSCLIKFGVGPTDNFQPKQLSSWNIDNLALGGTEIKWDVGIKKWITPTHGCNHTANDTVKVIISNYAGKPTKNPIPLMYSFTGNITQTAIDTFYGTLMPGQDTLFVFSKTVDLSNHYNYDSSQVFASTLLPTDQYTENDTLHQNLLVFPTYHLPYADDFESSDGFWIPSGRNYTWEYGEPEGFHIFEASSGTNAWVTDLDYNHSNNDSSFLTSPCFNFSDQRYAIIQFDYILDLEQYKDGAVMDYSIDGGDTWSVIEKQNDGPANWPWYNNDTIESLGIKGWDTTFSNWKTIKQILPGEITGQSKVQFRIRFASNSNNVNEGIGFDNFMLYEVPAFGIDSITYPESACELSPAENIKTAITNYYFDTLHAGDTLHIGVDFNGEPTVIDTFVLSKDLAQGDTLHYTLKNTFDMYQSGIYELIAYPVFNLATSEGDTTKADLNIINDTVNKSVVVRKPYVEFGGTKYTCYPDTIILDAYPGPDNKYAWQKAGSNDTISKDSVYHVPEEGIYNVIVTDKSTGCIAKDTVEIVRLIADIGVSNIANPQSDCELGDSVPVAIEITNYGTDTIRANYYVVAGYQFEGGLPVSDTFMIADTVYPDSTYIHYFDSVENMLVEKSYNFEAYIDTILTTYKEDDTTANDTVNMNVHVWGYPTFSITPRDTVHVGFTFRLNARQGDTTYKYFTWEDASTDSTLLIDTVGYPDYYTVTVADVHNCPAVDSSLITLVIPDVSVTEIITPENTCGDMTSEPIKVEITNVGSDTIRPITPIPIIYQVNSNPVVKDTIVLTSNFYPNDSLTFTFNDSLTIAAGSTFAFKSYTAMNRDSVKSNDTLFSQLTTYILPMVDLDYGEDDTTYYDIAEYTLDAGSEFPGYQWHNNDTTRTFVLNSSTFTGDDMYSVTVTDTNGCQASDQVKIKLVYTDISILSIQMRDTSCGLTPNDPVEALMKNNGTRPLTSGNISVNYSVNQGNLVQETLPVTNISDTIFPGNTFVYQFDSTYVNKNVGSFDYEVIAKIFNDIVTGNDTARKTIYSEGMPEVVWNNPGDTAYVAFPHTLTLAQSYDAYLWQDGSTNPSFEVNASGTYHVTVYNTANCSANDSIHIIESFTDVEITSITLPDTACNINQSHNMNVLFTNTGTQTLNTNDIRLSYIINGGDILTETFRITDITDTVAPGDTFSYAFDSTIALSQNGSYMYKIISSTDNDSIYYNDTLTKNVYLHGIPDIGWNGDTITTDLPYEISISGSYASYTWGDGSTGSTYTANAMDHYFVTVTNSKSCSSNDSIFIEIYYDDISPVALAHDTVCGITDMYPLEVTLKNKGTNILTSNLVTISYMYDQSNKVTEQFRVNAIPGGTNIYPDETFVYTFDSVIKRDSPGNLNIKVITNLSGDLFTRNDTLDGSAHLLGAPEIQWETASDTLETSFPHTLSLTNTYQAYLWDDASTESTLEVTQQGIYSVTVTAMNQCKAKSSIFVAPVGIEELANDYFDLSIFPVPAHEFFNIELNAESNTNFVLKMYNTQNKLVHVSKYKNKRYISEQLDVKDLSRGLYFLVISSDKGYVLRKIILE